MRARSILAMIIVASAVPNATPVHAERRPAPAPQLPNPGTLLRAGRATNSIGTDSAGPSMIGFVRAAVQDGRGNIYVLDDANFPLRAFDRSGKLLSTVGRNGRGPGDLSQPNGLAHDGDSLLYVSDRNNGISVYSAGNGPLRFRRALFTDARPGGVCAARGRVYVAMAVGDQLVHEISANGRVLLSFAPILGADSAAILTMAA